MRKAAAVRWVVRGLVALTLPLLTTCAPSGVLLDGVTATAVGPVAARSPAPGELAPPGAASPVVGSTIEDAPTPAPPRIQPPPPVPLPVEAAPEPVHLSIPAIGVDSPLVRLGLDGEGAMEVPSDFDLAGWYRHGARPGTPGPLVVAGHVDSRTGPAVFYRLRELAVGDSVEVRTASGAATYRVDEIARYSKDELPTFAVFGHTPDHVLRLVTCDGVFDSSQRSYRDNLVVSASPVHPAAP